MKKHVSFLTLATALLLGACSTYEEVPAISGGDATTVGFLADIAPREQSRADINVDFETGLTGTWNGEDHLGILANDFTKLLQFTYAPDSKAFTGSLSGTTGTWAYRAFYPHNGKATVSGTTVTVPFNALRTQNGNKYNSEFDIMAADAITHSGANPGKTPDGNAVKFNLHRITSILALKLQGGASSEKIASIMLSSEKPIASEQLTFTIPSDPTTEYDPSAINPTLTADGTSATGTPISIDSKHITVTYVDGTAPSANYSETFFNVLPDDNYGKLTFSICTDKGNAASFTVTRTAPIKANWVYTVDKSATFAKAAAPAVEWLGHEDLTTPTELADAGNSADIRVNAPGGIKSMQVDITSSVLTTPMEGSDESLLQMAGLAPSMELTNPANDEMAASLAELGFPTPVQLLNQQYVFFQIGGLIDMLAMVSPADQTTTADFKFTVTDNAGTSTDITLKFTKTSTMPTITYNNDADLWNNTASLTVSNVPDNGTNIKVQYRRKKTVDWKDASGNGNGIWTIAPVWSEAADNGSGKTTYTVDNTTGVFANNSYEYQLIYTDAQNIQQVVSGEFSTKTGDTIPTIAKDESSTCYSIDNTNATFWGSGNNNSFTSVGTDKLCTYVEPYAFLHGSYAVIVLAPGNLFTGTFNFASQGLTQKTGTVGFGQKYVYTARPTALQLNYKAAFNTDSKGCRKKWSHANELQSTDKDQASIMVCIINWSERHNVASGSAAAPSGVWSPESLVGLSETEKAGLIAYGVAYPDEDVNTGTQLNIPLIYYDKDAPAPDGNPDNGNYTIIISCATSRYGDYLNGSANDLHVKDFEWVY